MCIHRPKSELVMAVAAGLIMACSHAGPKAEDQPQGTRGAALDTVCFTGGLSGFYELSDREIVLRRSPSDAVLVETGFCPNLEALEGIRIDGADQCLSRGDRLQVFDTPFPRADDPGDQPDRCLVQAIHEWVPLESEGS